MSFSGQSLRQPRPLRVVDLLQKLYATIKIDLHPNHFFTPKLSHFLLKKKNKKQSHRF